MSAIGTLEYDYTVHSRTGADDEKLLVKFFIDATQDPAASKKEGRPIYKEVEWIDIRVPGDKDNIVVRPARQKDRERFPRHYAAFKQRQEDGKQELVGTPLSLWPGVTPSQLKEFEFFNIRTVEQLSNAPDNLGQKFMGFNKLKQAAAAYIEATKSAAPVVNLQEQLDVLTKKFDELLEDYKDLEDENVELRKARKKKKVKPSTE
jgi:hypothetical protein